MVVMFSRQIIGASNPRRRGTAMIWSIVSMVTLMAFISLAVDMARVQVAKTELQRARRCGLTICIDWDFRRHVREQSPDGRIGQHL